MASISWSVVPPSINPSWWLGRRVRAVDEGRDPNQEDLDVSAYIASLNPKTLSLSAIVSAPPRVFRKAQKAHSGTDSERWEEAEASGTLAPSTTSAQAIIES